MATDTNRHKTATSASRLRRLLPRDPASDPEGDKLEALLQKLSQQRPPVSSFSRLWLLGSLQAKVTCGYLAYWLRSRFAGTERKEALKNEAHLAAALRLFGTMGYLRGAVMKVGQMLAGLPEVLPEEFSEVLAALHFQAPPMHYALIRELFLDEFGRVFASFERQAFAAASLGQVHRARLPSGQEVAVKIQYPDIARTIRSDLRNLRLLLQPMRMSRDWPYLLEKLADIEQMLEMETDYRQEADFTTEIRALFPPAEGIVIPEVFQDFSTQRVLTTAYLPGLHLNQYLAT
ncbi:MAG: AarF/UbiB family protein, partial [Desulfuromonadaceae bacterium]